MKPTEETLARADEALRLAERFLPRLDADLLDQAAKEEEEDEHVQDRDE
jgi:hypothetical protein